MTNIHVDYDSRNHDFLVKKEIEGFHALNEEAEIHRIKDTVLKTKFLDSQCAIKAKLITLVAPEAKQWSLTTTAKEMIKQIIISNTRLYLGGA